jgi:hypothetical protein
VSLDDSDYAPPRHMQPGTKLALGLLATCLAAGLVMGIVALTCCKTATTRIASRRPWSF